MTDAILEQVRARELARIEAELEAELDSEWADLHRYVSLERDRKFVVSQWWRPVRGPRRMPKLWKIACYWAETDTFGKVRLGAPYCFGCHKGVPESFGRPDPETRWSAASSFLDRAHLVDRCLGPFSA